MVTSSESCSVLTFLGALVFSVLHYSVTHLTLSIRADYHVVVVYHCLRAFIRGLYTLKLNDCDMLYLPPPKQQDLYVDRLVFGGTAYVMCIFVSTDF